jgi:L-histidine N-alpha-methyltransferase
MNRNAILVRSPRRLSANDPSFEADVVAGLGDRKKSLPSKYFYDATGSVLFDRITGVQEYYVTRSETGILSSNGPAIGSLFPSNCALVELGAGSSRKSRILLGATASIGAYVPVDISGDFLRKDVAKLKTDFPHLAVYPLVCDFTKAFELPETIASSPRVGFFPGSTIGNFEPGEAGRLLQHFGRALAQDAVLVVGVDLVKERRILNSAYNDAQGVTARFNLNLLRRINRELGANFNPEAFRHHAFYNERESRVEMHLVSKCRQEVHVKGHVFQFYAGETIHTENSYKYTAESFQSLAKRSGWSAIGLWTDSLFSVHAFVNR